MCLPLITMLKFEKIDVSDSGFASCSHRQDAYIGGLLLQVIGHSRIYCGWNVLWMSMSFHLHAMSCRDGMFYVGVHEEVTYGFDIGSVDGLKCTLGAKRGGTRLRLSQMTCTCSRTRPRNSLIGRSSTQPKDLIIRCPQTFDREEPSLLDIISLFDQSHKVPSSLYN
jgi:hypothetical protein